MSALAMEQPRVLLISVELSPEFDEVYRAHLKKLAKNAIIQRAKTANEAILALYHVPAFVAVIVTDNAIVKRYHTQVYETLLKYVRHGGTAIFMGYFPNSTPPTELKPFFLKAGLQWEGGSYRQADFALNSTAVDAELAAKLPPKYHQKAFALRSVKSSEAWYRSDRSEEHPTHLLAWPSETLPRQPEAAVAVAKIGKGKFAYLGDANAEDGTGDVILALCGFL